MVSDIHIQQKTIICLSDDMVVICVYLKMDDSQLEQPVFKPDAEKLRGLTIRLQQTFGLDLFGIDVIIENVTGRYAIIDVNTFPGLLIQHNE